MTIGSATKDFPEGMEPNFTWQGNGKDVADLETFHMRDGTGDRFISCWQLSPEEIEEVKRTGKVLLSVYGVHPPVLVHTGLSVDWAAVERIRKEQENGEFGKSN